jgi:hypothetical protein
MVRTQIQLTEAQARSLRRMAAQQKVSMAELVRRAVDRMLESQREPDRKERWERALGMAGRFRSGRSDVARKHDEHLAEVMGK